MFPLHDSHDVSLITTQRSATELILSGKNSAANITAGLQDAASAALLSFESRATGGCAHQMISMTQDTFLTHCIFQLSTSGM